MARHLTVIASGEAKRSALRAWRDGKDLPVAHLLPAMGVAIVAQTGNMYNGLWYPIIFASITFVIGMLFVKETKDVDIYADD